MRVLMVIGILLILFGIFALAFQGVTFFTQERVVNVGPLKIDVQRPHTIVLHPIVGVAALAGGIVLAIVGSRSRVT